jgi:hypothetical protein
MKRKTFESGIRACLLGAALAGGCNHQEVPLAKQDGELLPPMASWAQKDSKSSTTPTKPQLDSKVTQTAYTPTSGQAKTTTSSNLPPVVFADAPPSTTSAVTVQTSDKSKAASPQDFVVPVVAGSTKSAESAPTVAVSTSVVPTLPAAIPPATTVAATPLPKTAESKPVVASPTVDNSGAFGHAPDYSWLCGQVQQTHKGWRLRYASISESDSYGGSVTLTDDARLSQLKDGEIVRVQGHLQSPDDHVIAPVYVIHGFQPQTR